jgi:hypothetical protein
MRSFTARQCAAIVTAIIHERDRRIVWAENMIVPVVHGTIETIPYPIQF